MIKNLFISLVLLISAFETSLAVPATPKPFYIQQSDTTILTVYLRGDEFCHYYSTEDNVPLIKNSDNSFYYAKIENSLLVASGLLAHNPKFRTVEEKDFIAVNKNIILDSLEYIHRVSSKRNVPASSRAVSLASNKSDKRFNHIGQKKMLIILMEFPNQEMTYSHQEIDRQYNEPGFNSYNHIGSIHDYFYHQSYGNFDLTFDVVGPFMALQNMEHYGQNDFFGNDKYIGELITEAVMMADDYVDYQDYDWDGDGKVDQVFITYAGYSEASGAPSNTIWPHQWSLSDCKDVGNCKGPIRLDGILINKYACASELSGNSGYKLDGIGTFCHEFSHCLGIPDFYDTQYGGGRGMSYWDIMDSGCYNGPELNGENPSGYSAYERWKCGWLDFIELDRPTHIVDMPCILDEPVAYIIRCDQNDSEYLLLENRQNRDWFQYVAYSDQCHGMLVTHVDFNSQDWNNNTVNNTKNHQRMSFIPADNQYNDTNQGLEGDLFPGAYSVKELTAESHKKVGGFWYNADNKKLDYDKPITNISEENGLISFNFSPRIPAPEPGITTIEVESSSSVRVQWQTEEDADFYEIEISENPRYAFNSCIIDKDFDKMCKNVRYRGLIPDNVLNLYFKMEDWQCANCYITDEGFAMKADDSGEQSLMKSPMLDTTENALTISVTYNILEESKENTEDTDNNKDTDNKDSIENNSNQESNPEVVLSVFAYNEQGDIIDNMDSSAIEETQIFHLSKKEFEQCGVGFSTKSKIKISQIKIYDGDFSEYSLTEEGMEEDKLKPVFTFSQTVTDGNECVFEDLSPNNYKIRMRVNCFDTFSDWTDYTYFTINMPDGILNVESDTEEPTGIYNLQGMKIDQIRNSGIYILKYPNRAEKRFIRF